MTLQAIDAIRMVSQDGERLVRFYAALGFVVAPPQEIAARHMARLGLGGGGRRWPMQLGKQRVAIEQYERSGAAYPDAPNSAAPSFQHFAVVTTRIEGDWQRALAAGAIPISDRGPVRLPPGSGGVTAVKFRDPEGHPLEFLQFPDPASHGWHGKGTLGIDHSAISVLDLAQMIAFFEARGLSCGAGSHNRGPGQDQLDGLSDADVQVRPLTPLSAPPHLELLAYQRSSASHPYRGAVNDVASTRIVWEADSEEQLFRDPSGHWHETV